MDTYQFRIMLASKDDVKDLVNFFTEEREVFVGINESLTKHLQQYLDCKSRYAIVALNEDGVCKSPSNLIVGFAAVDIIDRPRGGRFAYLGEVYVARKFRENGIATGLVKFACEQAARVSCHRITLHCDKALESLYAPLGFKEWEVGYKMDFR